MNLIQLNIKSALHYIVFAESRGCTDVSVIFAAGQLELDCQMIAPKCVEFIPITFTVDKTGE